MVLKPRCAGELFIIEMPVLDITSMSGEGEDEQYNDKVVNQDSSALPSIHNVCYLPNISILCKLASSCKLQNFKKWSK